MAMRLYTREELEDELLRRGCTKLPHADDANGTYWKRPDGQVFQVPPPEEVWQDEFRYPDWMLDDLIEVHGLPAAPNKNH